MSIESARIFVQKMYTDMDFANQVIKIEDKKEFYDFIAKEGYDFTSEELKEVDQEFRKKVSGELSDAELSMVVGGLPMIPPCTPRSTTRFCKETQ